FGGPERLVADGYPFWVDARTPPKKEGNKAVGNWLTRPRDFYWTLDQATLDFVKGQEGTLLVGLGQSMPFFQRYRGEVDGTEVKAAANPFPWKLNAGANRIEVTPVDKYGRAGRKSTAEVSYALAD